MSDERQVIAYFNRLFHPRAIAIIGASDNPVRGSSGFLQALKEMGFPKLYPVNPYVENAMGMKCYPNIQDVPEEVDLAIIGVPRQLVPKALEDCIKKGVRFAHIFTAGFSETGRDEGKELEYQLVNVARGRIRLIGPNCMGVHCPGSRISWARHHKTISGDVALISQSGGHASHFIELACEKAMGISKVISVGNSSDLRMSDFLEYMLADPETNIIGLYIEGFPQNGGRSFYDLIKGVNSHKPVVVWKAGKTLDGARAASSHTASIAGSYDVFLSAAHQLGLIPVSSMEEMIGLILALKALPLPRGPRVGVVGIGGGQSVAITDSLSLLGLEVPILEDETQKRITQITTESGTMVKNPVDPAIASLDPQNIKDLLLIMAEDKNIDAILFHQNVDFLLAWKERGADIDLERIKEDLGDAIDGVRKNSRKPILCAFTSRSDAIEVFGEWSSIRDTFQEKGIHVYPSVEKAGRVLSSLYRYAQSLNRLNN